MAKLLIFYKSSDRLKLFIFMIFFLLATFYVPMPFDGSFGFNTAEMCVETSCIRRIKSVFVTICCESFKWALSNSIESSHSI